MISYQKLEDDDDAESEASEYDEEEAFESPE